MSRFGDQFRVTLFGESHGQAVGCLVEGMPAGVEVDTEFLQQQLDRRKPGQSAVTTQRREDDVADLLSGVHEGVTTGAPLLVVSRNRDKDSSKYNPDLPRPGHSDLAGRIKFFGHNDWRGAGHFGGRLTFGLVAAGALARTAMRRFGVEFLSYTQSIGEHELEGTPDFDQALTAVDENEVRCPDAELAGRMREAILKTRNKGDSLGGVVRCRVRGVPAGLGGYHARSFESRMGQLMLGVPAVKGIGFGQGFGLARMRGTEANDPIGLVDGRPQALTGRQGGTVGGVTDGSEVSFDVAFKPTSSVLVDQDTVDLSRNQPAKVATQGRHDPCIVPRAVPVVENAAAVAVMDMLIERLGEEGFQAGGAP